MITPPQFLPTKPVPCRTQPTLFDPPTRAELGTPLYSARVEAARDLCLDCPVMLACAAWARTHAEWGTWGGETDDDRGIDRHELPDAPRRQTSVPRRECGSLASARAHFARGEHCHTCQAVWDATTRARRLRALAREHRLGGTRRGWHLHQQLGIPRDGCGCVATVNRRKEAA